MWKRNEIDLSRNDHFFGDGLSDSSFLFPPNPIVYLFGLTVLYVDVLLLERLKVKYIGLKLDENEGDHRIFTVHDIEFLKEDCRKWYQLVAVTKEFDMNLSFEENDVMHYDVWEFCADTYDCFRVYYNEYADEDGVTVYRRVVLEEVRMTRTMSLIDGCGRGWRERETGNGGRAKGMGMGMGTAGNG